MFTVAAPLPDRAKLTGLTVRQWGVVNFANFACCRTACPSTSPAKSLDRIAELKAQMHQSRKVVYSATVSSIVGSNSFDRASPSAGEGLRSNREPARRDDATRPAGNPGLDPGATRPTSRIYSVAASPSIVIQGSNSFGWSPVKFPRISSFGVPSSSPVMVAVSISGAIR